MARLQTGNLFHPEPTDVLIAVMGITGSGKSTFISNCTTENVPTSATLQSHTKGVKAYRYKLNDVKAIYLIDTPGFDDTERDDTEVLRDIAAWITDAYKRNVQLRGILYLHRVTDTRMQGAAMRNLFMFKKLCGPDALKNVILVTTMWENDTSKHGDRREQELRSTPEYWGSMIEKGSQIVRHYNNPASAMRIVNVLLSRQDDATLTIQDEMVNQDMHLDQTSAGQVLQGSLAKDHERFTRELANLEREMVDAQAARDIESQEAIQKLQDEKNAEISRLQQRQERMRISLERLHKEKYGELEERLREQQLVLNQQRKRIQGVTAEARRAEREHEQEIQTLVGQLRPELPDNTLALFKNKEGKPMVRLLLSGKKHIFHGPSQMVWNVPCKATNIVYHCLVDHPTTTDILAVSQNEWVVRYSNERGNRKLAIDLKYNHALLREYLYKTDPNGVEFISLGHNGNYFFKYAGGCRWELADQVNNLPQDLHRLWFGYTDAWVAKYPKKGKKDDFELRWDLKGHYSGLEAFLASESGCEKCSESRVAELALDLEGGQWWIVTFADMHGHFKLADKTNIDYKEFMTLNFPKLHSEKYPVTKKKKALENSSAPVSPQQRQ